MLFLVKRIQRVFLLYRNSHRLLDATLMRACCLLPKQFQLILLRKRDLGITSAVKDSISHSYCDIISADRKEHRSVSSVRCLKDSDSCIQCCVWAVTFKGEQGCRYSNSACVGAFAL